MDIVAHAREFASEKHRTQTRKYTNEPYVAHLDAVVGLLGEQGITDQNIVASAYLHDTVEDTDTSLQDIMRIFGDEIAQLVYWLTDAEKGNRRARMAMASWRLGRAPWEAEKREVLAEMAKNEGDRITNHPLYQRAAAQIMVTPT